MASTRVAEFAFDYARKLGRKKVGARYGWRWRSAGCAGRAALAAAVLPVPLGRVAGVGLGRQRSGCRCDSLPAPALPSPAPKQVTAVHKANIMKLADGLFIK